MTAACVGVLPVRSFGGHEKMLVEWLAQAVAQHGLRVRLFGARNERLIRACESAGLEPPVVRYPDRAGALRDFLITWRLLARIPRAIPVLFAPGVVQASPLQWLAALLRRRRVIAYVPMAYSARHMRFRGGALRDWLVRQLVRHVDLWITVTDRQRDLLKEFWRIEAPVLVLPNRLALPLRQARHAARAPLRVVFAGRFEPYQKGLDWLSERLRARHSEWSGRLSFTFTGEGQFRAALLRLAGELGPQNVRVHPWSELAAAMEEADVILLPSRFEGLPLVALEAIHYGVPVVASNDAGVADIIAPSFLFDLGDGEAMWKALHRLQDPAERQAAIQHSRRRIDALLSAASFHRQIARLVEALQT